MNVPLTRPLLPDHTLLPFQDDKVSSNLQEHPQAMLLTGSIEPVLQRLHPDGQYCIGQDSFIYWRITEPPERGAKAPDWFYVPGCLRPWTASAGRTCCGRS